MAKRFDVMNPRPRDEGKTFWHRVGTAWDGEKGMTAYLDSLPLPDKDGRVVLKFFEAREKQQDHQREQTDAPF